MKRLAVTLLALVLLAAPVAIEAQLAGKIHLLTTAKALGLTIPPSVLARADEVIQ